MKIIVFTLLSCTLCCPFLTGAQRKITWKELDNRVLKIDSLEYKNSAGSGLQLFYQLPNKIKPTKKYPVIIFIHGGAWTGGSASTFFSYAAYFAARNMVGVSIDYRLIKQPGDDIINCIADCKSAIRFIKKNAAPLHIDTNKIVICGESAGGHLAASMELLDGFNTESDDVAISTKPAALILLNPVVNLTTNIFIKYMDAALVTSKDKLPDSVLLVRRYLEKAVNVSPLYQVKNLLPPTLVINGLNDKVTPPEFAKAFADSANQFKSNCKLALLPNTGHAFAVPHYKASEATVVQTVISIEQFLKGLKYIKGKSAIVSGNDPNWIIKR